MAFATEASLKTGVNYGAFMRRADVAI